MWFFSSKTPPEMDADVEAAPRDVELSALEAEKQPMASPESGGAGPEKNGLVKAAGPGEAAGPKFTGLGKEELLRAAAAPGWARARTALLAAFWLGWLGMLGAAAAIVARAPRCHVTGSGEWWRSGGLYRAPRKSLKGNCRVSGGRKGGAGCNRGTPLSHEAVVLPMGAPPHPQNDLSLLLGGSVAPPSPLSLF